VISQSDGSKRDCPSSISAARRPNRQAKWQQQLISQIRSDGNISHQVFPHGINGSFGNRFLNFARSADAVWSANFRDDADRLRKYLARFDLSWNDIRQSSS